MKRAYLLAQALSTPWAMAPNHLDNLLNALTRWTYGIGASDEVMASIHADMEARVARQSESARAAGSSIAVIPVSGAIVNRAASADQVSGGGLCSAERLSGMLNAALAEPAVGGILLDIDSPGGGVFGVEELANEIRSARDQKPIFAFANGLAASAAYWIGAAATKFYSVPTGQVGSIGVYTAHQDVSKALEIAGVKTTMISAGRRKVEGNSFEPLTDESRASIQGMVDDYYSMFVKSVAKSRGVTPSQVRDDMGEGAVVAASKAKDAGMIDGVATLPEVVGLLGKAMMRQKSSGSRVAQARRNIAILSA